MVKVKLHPGIVSLRGAMADMVFKRYGDKIILSAKPDFTGVVWSPAQVAARQNFREGMQYSKKALADPPARAAYQAAADAMGKPIVSVMVSDFLREPVVDSIDTSSYKRRQGGTLVVCAHDNFEVVGVDVRIETAAGSLVETGAAAPVGGDLWHYVATATAPAGVGLRITAAAVDRPGHTAELSVEL